MDIKILNNAYPLPKYDDYLNSPQFPLYLLTKAVRYVELKTRGFQYPELLTKEEQKLIETWLIPELIAHKIIKQEHNTDKTKELELLKLKAKAAKAKLNLLKLKTKELWQK